MGLSWDDIAVALIELMIKIPTAVIVTLMIVLVGTQLSPGPARRLAGRVCEVCCVVCRIWRLLLLPLVMV